MISALVSESSGAHLPRAASAADVEGTWTHALPAGARIIDVPFGPGAVRLLRRQLASVPHGSPVALVRRGPRAVWVRWAAARAGLRIERELVAVPRLAPTCYLVEADPETVSWLLRSVLAIPPGVSWMAAPASLAIHLVRRVIPPRLLLALLPDRVVIGVRR